jgi:uncharacterized protein with PIN domain
VNSKPPDPPVFFIDRSLGKKIADALRVKGIQVEVHDDHFSPDEKDEVWLLCVGRKGWIILTKDKRIRYRNIEKHAVKKANTSIFTLLRGDLKAIEMANIFIKALPKIKRFISKHRPPFIAKVTKSGSVSMLVDL